MKKIQLAAVVCSMGVLFANCSSSTMIRTTDPSAKIYADGELIGTGAGTYSDTKTILSSATEIKIQKAGCAPVTERISRSEFDVGACIGGVFLAVPFLWIEKYKSEYNFEYSCVSQK